MALANTLSVLLNFKTDLSGLAKFSGFLNGRVKEVEEFNKKLQNGTAAINSALQAGAAYLGVQALRDYSREAIQARQTQAQLAQALKQTKQNTADYREELGAQASAFQRLTGLEDDQIAAVQRQLVFAGVQRKDMADLTRLTLDFAAAKEIDAVSAAKAVGRAVQGEGDELARYGVVVDTTRDKIVALRDGLGKFAGQSGVAFGSLPEGLRELSVAAKEGKQTFGELVLEISNPLLQGFADAINRGTESLNAMRKEGSATTAIFAGLSQTVGTVVGMVGDKLALLVTGLLAIKAGSLLASQGMSVLAAGFMYFTGGNIAQVLASVQSMSKEIGLLRTLSMGGWSAILATGLLAVGAALAALGVGSVLINSVEAAQLARLEREQKIRDAIHDQTRALQHQAAAARTRSDVAEVRAQAEKQVATDKARIAELEAMVADQVVSATDSGTVVTQRLSTRTAEQEAELEGLRLTLPLRERGLAYVESQAFAERAAAEAAKDRLAAQRALQKEADAKLTEKLPENRQRLDELNLAALDPAARAQELMRRREALGEQLSGLGTAQEGEAKRVDLQVRIAQLSEQISTALDQQAAKVKEINEAGKQRQKDAADEARKQHQLAALKTEQDYSRALGEIGVERARIEQDRMLTTEEKQRLMLPLLQRENQLITDRIALLLREQQEANPEERLQLQEKIDALRSEQARNAGSQVDARPTTFGEGVMQGVRGQGGFLDGLGTQAQDAASTVNGTLNAALNSTQGLLFNLSSGAMGFREAWGQAIMQVGQQFLQSATMMVAKMIWRATVERALVAMGVTLHVGGEQAKTGASLLGGAKRLAMAAKEAMASVFHGAVEAFKAMAGIPYVGPFLAAGAMAAALAGGMALVKQIGGHQEGGIVRGGRQLSWLNEDGRTESVLNADATAMLGHDFINRANAGAFDFRALPSQLVAGLSLPRESASPARARAGGRISSAQSLLDEQGAAPAGGFHGNVIVAMGEDYLHDAMASSTGRTIIVRSTARDRRGLGIST